MNYSTIEEIESTFNNNDFTQPEVIESGFISIDTDQGCFIYPDTEFTLEEIKGIHRDCRIYEVYEQETGWLARMSANGYLDCTEWEVFETKQEAWEYLAENYGVYDD